MYEVQEQTTFVGIRASWFDQGNTIDTWSRRGDHFFVCSLWQRQLLESLPLEKDKKFTYHRTR